MAQIIYSHKIRDPQSQAVNPLDKYLVCMKINNNWHIVQSNWSINAAERAKSILAEHDLINGHITDTSAWQVFHRDHVEIKEKFDD